MTAFINTWSRTLGVSLRPWSGYAPWSLIIRGVIQGVVSVLILVFLIRGALSGLEASASELEFLRGWVFLAIVGVSVVLLIAVLRLVVGIIDLVPRSTVEGTVLSIRDRKAGDFLPRMAQRVIFERNPNAIDRRRERLEVVLDALGGVRQWTVRNTRLRQHLIEGASVRLTVSPIVGYVAAVERVQ